MFLTIYQSSRHTSLRLNRFEPTLRFKELLLVRTIRIDWHLLPHRLHDTDYLLLLQVHIHVLLLKSVSLWNQSNQLVQRHRNKRQVLEIYVKEICRYATNNSLMPNHKHRMLLPLDPVYQGLQPSNNIQITLTTRVPKLQLL